MQKVNSILSIVLLILVGYLLFDKFSGGGEVGEEEPITETQSDSLEAGPKPFEGKIAYVNLDTINNNFLYLEDKMEELKTEQEIKRKEIARQTQRFEARYAELMQTNFTSQAQLDAAETEMANKQSQLSATQERYANQLLDQELTIQKDLNNRLQGKIDEVNAKYGYDYILAKATGGGVLVTNEAYDLTQEVLEGLNADYEAELAAPDTGIEEAQTPSK